MHESAVRLVENRIGKISIFANAYNLFIQTTDLFTATVFNNPLNSFHDTVAEAKQEREQLDRLLTISTPRERLLIVIIAIFLILFAAWILFGNVTRSLAVDGVLIGPSENLSEDRPALQVLIVGKTEDTSHFKAGTPVAIELSLADGNVDSLDGEVISITAVPISQDWADLHPSAPFFVYQANITIEKSLDFSSLSGRKCQIVLQLDEQPPITAFLNRQT